MAFATKWGNFLIFCGCCGWFGSAPQPQQHAGHAAAGQHGGPPGLGQPPQDGGAQRHGDGRAVFGAAADVAAGLPVAQHGAKQFVAVQPGMDAWAAAGGGPTGHQDKDGGGQARQKDTGNAQAQAQQCKKT